MDFAIARSDGGCDGNRRKSDTKAQSRRQITTTNIPTLSFLTGRMPSCRPTNTVKQ